MFLHQLCLQQLTLIVFISIQSHSAQLTLDVFVTFQMSDFAEKPK